jgi:hypothetical protein
MYPKEPGKRRRSGRPALGRLAMMPAYQCRWSSLGRGDGFFAAPIPNEGGTAGAGAPSRGHGAAYHRRDGPRNVVRLDVHEVRLPPHSHRGRRRRSGK